MRNRPRHPHRAATRLATRLARASVAVIALSTLAATDSCPKPGDAGEITIAFEGVVEEVVDGIGELGGKVSEGDPIRGSYTFVPGIAEIMGPSRGTATIYHWRAAPAGVEVEIGPVSFRSEPSSPDFEIQVTPGAGPGDPDEFGFTSRRNQTESLVSRSGQGLVDSIEISWHAVDESGTSLASAELPTTAPDLKRLGGGEFTIYGNCSQCMGPNAFFRIRGRLTSIGPA